ncbi:M24 family metallopeptidase [Alteromonas sp. H39]|uniref:M24 family metallopeptidase n=1 Tax=Alteromonas sp. H39 TaxID=3389876 RepID=UPI0039E1BB71
MKLLKNMTLATTLFGLILVSSLPAVGEQNDVLSLRERAQLRDTIVNDRLTTMLPALMRRQGIDMWILIAREYNEDPVLKTMLPSAWESARRRTMLVIFDDEVRNRTEYLAVARYNVGEVFEKAWDPEEQPDQYEALAGLIKQRNPEKIGINQSLHFGLADGLTHTEYTLLTAALDTSLRSRLVSAEYLSVAWLETRTPKEMEIYPTLVAKGHELIARAFSNEVVTPGTTTTKDIEWWLKEQSQALKMDNWFHPSVSLQRPNASKENDFSSKSASTVIRPGDLLHVDFGLTYLGLNSDQQQHAYVLKPGETQAPASLRDALESGNRLQDILMSHFKLGRTGNDILAMSRKQAIEEGIVPTIYTHPIGTHGHAAGTTIGMWDSQSGVPVDGDYPMQKNTAYSIELNAAVPVPDWGGDIRIMLEEQAFFDGERVQYMDGRQTHLHLIQSE